MFGFRKKTPKTEIPLAESTEDSPTESKGLFQRLKAGLAKTSGALTDGMSDLFRGKKKIDDELLEELESRLLMADVGIDATTAIIADLTQQVQRDELADSGALYSALSKSMIERLAPVSQPLVIDAQKKPFVILVAGINGAGKTTTIGKLAKNFSDGGYSVMLAAGDTFRAAAVEQLKVWGDRNNIAVVSQGTGADSASVIFDALESAKARGVDILLADTAGRLHTQEHLMEELKKVKRVMSKIDGSAPHEVLLVLDGGTGQNALRQAEAFNEVIGITGLAVTKLDGTAKGGVLIALAEKLGIPIRYIGVGEGIEDLRIFDAEEFVNALLKPEDDQDPA